MPLPELPLPSPCIGVCMLDEATGYCRGCFRTVDEITAWRDADNGLRREILERLPARRAAAGQRTPAGTATPADR